MSDISTNKDNSLVLKKDKKIDDLSFFNLNYFRFLFISTIKKISIYISITIYFILILSYTVIGPLLADLPPIDLFNFPSMSVFMMFFVVVMTSFIAIEIFRTSIDDGTELLIVSKPLSRSQIVSMKLIVFITITLIVSFLGFLLSLFTFATNLGNVQDNLYIVFGIFVGTLIVSIIFGALAIFLSLFFKKIISLIITISISFVLIIYSMMLSFIIKSPLSDAAIDNKVMSAATIITNNNGNVKSENGLYIPYVNSILIKDPNTTNNISSPKKIWEQYANRPIDYFSAYSDFASQLSSLFVLNKPSTDFYTVINSMKVFNNSIKLNFTNSDTSEDLKNAINIPFEITNQYRKKNNLNQELLNINYDMLNNDKFYLTKTSSTRIESSNQTYNQRIDFSNDELDKIINNIFNSEKNENGEYDIQKSIWVNFYDNLIKNELSNKGMNEKPSEWSQIKDVLMEVIFLKETNDKKWSIKNDKKRTLKEVTKLQISALNYINNEINNKKNKKFNIALFFDFMPKSKQSEYPNYNIPGYFDEWSLSELEDLFMFNRAAKFLLIPNGSNNPITKKWGEYYLELEKNNSPIVETIKEYDIHKNLKYRSTLQLLGFWIVDGEPKKNLTKKDEIYSKNRWINYSKNDIENADKQRSWYEYKMMISLTDNLSNNFFNIVYVEKINNTVALVISWLCISIVLMSVSIYFYSKKDII